MREGGVEIPAEPVGRLPRSFQLHALAIRAAAVLVAGLHLAYIIELASEHILVVVVHVIEIGACCELRALIAIAKLHVLQLLGLQVLHLVVLVVVARGLLVAQGVTGIHAVVLVYLVVETELRVEEVEVVVCPVSLRAVHVDIIVARILHAVSHMAILQVEVGVETGEEGPRLLGIDVEVGLPRAVPVILVARVELVDFVLGPEHLSPVVADVFVPTAAEGRLEVFLVVVVDACHDAIEVVLHDLLACQVAFVFRVRQAVVHVVLASLVFVVVTIAVGVVQRHVGRPALSEQLVPDGLVVHLVIVVGLVLVVVHVALLVVIFAARVVASSVEALLIFGGVVPCVVCLLGAVPGHELHHRVV